MILWSTYVALGKSGPCQKFDFNFKPKIALNSPTISAVWLSIEKFPKSFTCVSHYDEYVS
jgi:hypothetical protein